MIDRRCLTISSCIKSATHPSITLLITFSQTMGPALDGSQRALGLPYRHAASEVPGSICISLTNRKRKMAHCKINARAVVYAKMMRVCVMKSCHVSSVTISNEELLPMTSRFMRLHLLFSVCCLGRIDRQLHMDCARQHRYRRMCQRRQCPRWPAL